MGVLMKPQLGEQIQPRKQHPWMSGARYHPIVNLSAVINPWPPHETGSCDPASQKPWNIGRNLQRRNQQTAAHEFPDWTYASWVYLLVLHKIWEYCQNPHALWLKSHRGRGVRKRVLYAWKQVVRVIQETHIYGSKWQTHPNHTLLLPRELSHVQQCGLIGMHFFPLNYPMQGSTSSHQSQTEIGEMTN